MTSAVIHSNKHIPPSSCPKFFGPFQRFIGQHLHIMDSRPNDHTLLVATGYKNGNHMRKSLKGSEFLMAMQRIPKFIVFHLR
jgi:hypothetical protein